MVRRSSLIYRRAWAAALIAAAHEATPTQHRELRDAAAAAQGAIEGAHDGSRLAHGTPTHDRHGAAAALTRLHETRRRRRRSRRTVRNLISMPTVADAAACSSAIDDHEIAPHNTDETARTAAAAAQARAEDAFALADEKVDAGGAATAAREVTSDWAEEGNPDPIPAPKLVNVINAHVDIANVLDGRLPGLPIVMRLGWSQSRMFTELDFDRPSPPIGGSISGMSDGLAAPPFPPGIDSDPTLFLGIWLAGDPDVVEITGGGAEFGDARPLTLDGDAGVYVVSTGRLGPLEGTIFSVTITGPRLVTEADLADHASDPDAHHTPSTGSMGGAPAVVLYEAATAAIGTASGLIAGNVVCPETGALEFYFEGLTGTRQGAVAYARIPAARVRGAVSALAATYSNNSATLLAIPHGANRGVGVAVQATTNYLMLSAQAPGDFFIRVAHTG